MSCEGDRDGAQLHDAHGVGSSAQLKVALGPSLQQQQHNVKQQQARVGTNAAEREAAGELAVRAYCAHAGGANSSTRHAELDVAGQNSSKCGKKGK